jgi:hypothetical protein
MILRLAKGLPERTLFSVYGRARKLFSGLTKTDTLTVEERQQILDLYQDFGNQYSLIAEKLLVDIKTVREIIRNTLKPNLKRIRKGLWDEKEENDLLKAIKDIFKDQDLKNSYQNIPWSLVATKMNRNEVQCRQHFYSTLCWKILHPDSQRKSCWKKHYDSIKLIYFLHRSDYENETQIDWDLLKEKFAEFVNYLIFFLIFFFLDIFFDLFFLFYSVIVFNKLTRIWYLLKISVPDYHLKSYRQIIEWLFENKVETDTRTQSDWESLEEFFVT